MTKIFGVIASIQHKEIEKICFGRCKKMLIGIIRDGQFGEIMPCGEENCPYETGRAKKSIGKVDGKDLWLRKIGRKGGEKKGEG